MCTKKKKTVFYATEWFRLSDAQISKRDVPVPLEISQIFLHILFMLSNFKSLLLLPKALRTFSLFFLIFKFPTFFSTFPIKKMASSSTFLTPATNLNTLFWFSNGQVCSKKDCDIFIHLCQTRSIEWIQGLVGSWPRYYDTINRI